MGEAAKDNLPTSFNELVTYLNERFDKLAVYVEQMRGRLREAEERSERLRRRLLIDGLLHQ